MITKKLSCKLQRIHCFRNATVVPMYYVHGKIFEVYTVFVFDGDITYHM